MRDRRLQTQELQQLCCLRMFAAQGKNDGDSPDSADTNIGNRLDNVQISFRQC